MTRSWIDALCALLLAISATHAAGCHQSYEPERATSFVAKGAAPTAVGEIADVRIQALDDIGYPLSSLHYGVERATCDLPGCIVSVHGTNVTVRSDVAGVAHVSVAVRANPNGNVDFTIPFRVPTKMIISRALGDSPAGTAFAMVPGDTQSWFVSPGDDEGPLAASPLAIEGPPNEYSYRIPSCRSDDTTEEARRGGATRLVCRLGSETPGSFDLTVSYKGIVRKETVRVIPLAAVRAAWLVSCRISEHREGDVSNSYPVPDLSLVEERALPCEPVTSIRYPGRDCPGARDRTLVPRLVLDDGTVAMGGAQYLFADGRGSVGSSGGGVDYVLDGSGTIIGKFGTATLSVPYSVDLPCAR